MTFCGSLTAGTVAPLSHFKCFLDVKVREHTVINTVDCWNFPESTDLVSIFLEKKTLLFDKIWSGSTEFPHFAIKLWTTPHLFSTGTGKRMVGRNLLRGIWHDIRIRKKGFFETFWSSTHSFFIVECSGECVEFCLWQLRSRVPQNITQGTISEKGRGNLVMVKPNLPIGIRGFPFIEIRCIQCRP